MLIDARSWSHPSNLACDLCIVGAGPAGIAIADRLRNSGLSIVLLESGGFNVEISTQSLYRGETRGSSYYRLDGCRWRLFGGSTNRWGSWCRPLESDDFTRRDWIPYSGWPIGAADLQPYQRDAARLFELPNDRFDLDDWRTRLPEPLGLDGTDFENTIFQHSPDTNFGERYRARVLAAENITTIIHANLTGIRLDPHSRRVGLLNVATLTGLTFSVRPHATVLATGGIENARLLLASRTDQSTGLGNEHDVVGRYFMEHLHVPLGHLLAPPGRWNQRFYVKAIFPDVRLRGVITPTQHSRRRHRLPATSIAIEAPTFTYGTAFLGWSPRVTFGPVSRYRNMRNGRLKHVAEWIKRAAEFAQVLPIRASTWNQSRLARSRVYPGHQGEQIFSLYFRGEQVPNPNNRVTLSDSTDALGVPESRLDWVVTPDDRDGLLRWLEIFDEQVRRKGLGQVIAPLKGWERGILGGPHHMGSTRMSDDPRFGVVDRHCRVHSVSNLYIAGSSVFATGGYVNPTFAIVGLALRLADTLRARLSAENSMLVSAE